MRVIIGLTGILCADEKEYLKQHQCETSEKARQEVLYVFPSWIPQPIIQSNHNYNTLNKGNYKPVTEYSIVT